MPDRIINDRLIAIKEHINVIERRMKSISKASDFRTKQGSVLFDSILIRLQALGENIKKIEEVHPNFIDEKLLIDVDNIIRFRDMVSHHYEKMDIEIIYDILIVHIPLLKKAVKNYLKAG